MRLYTLSHAEHARQVCSSQRNTCTEGERALVLREVALRCYVAQHFLAARLDLFKKTLPSPALLQMRTERSVREEALTAMQNAIKKNPQQFGFIELALQGKKVSFDKVIKMMDDMVVLLGEEQKDDDAQKSWCETEFESSGDKEVDLKHKLEGVTAAIEEMTGSIDTLKGEIKALEDGIVALDKSVAEATETRKAEHEEFVTVSAQNNAAVQLLGVAENRLNKSAPASQVSF